MFLQFLKGRPFKKCKNPCVFPIFEKQTIQKVQKHDVFLPILALQADQNRQKLDVFCIFWHGRGQNPGQWKEM